MSLSKESGKIKVQESNTSSSTLGLSQEQCPSHQESKNLKRKESYQEQNLRKVDEAKRTLYERYPNNHKRVKKNIDDFVSGKRFEPVLMVQTVSAPTTFSFGVASNPSITKRLTLNTCINEYKIKEEERSKLKQTLYPNKPNWRFTNDLDRLTNEDANVIKNIAKINEELKELEEIIIEFDCYQVLKNTMIDIDKSLEQELKKKREEINRYLISEK